MATITGGSSVMWSDLISPICCILLQFQWIAYEVYHLIYHTNLFTFHESTVKWGLLLNNSQLPLLNRYSKPNPVNLGITRSFSQFKVRKVSNIS